MYMTSEPGAIYDWLHLSDHRFLPVYLLMICSAKSAPFARSNRNHNAVVYNTTINNNNNNKYVDFTAAYIFHPIAVENLGSIDASALDFTSNLGQKHSYFYTPWQLPFWRRQRGPVLIPAYLCDDPTFQLRAFARLILHWLPGPIAIPAKFLTFVFTCKPGNLYYRGEKL